MLLDARSYGYTKRSFLLLATAAIISNFSLFYSLDKEKSKTGQGKSEPLIAPFQFKFVVFLIAFLGFGGAWLSNKRPDAKLFYEAIEKQIQSLHISVEGFSDGRTDWKEVVREVEISLEELDKKLEAAKEEYIPNNDPLPD